MKINFTKKEYRVLLDILYLGQWMSDSHETELANRNGEFEMLIQKIYSHAKEMGCEEYIEASKELNTYCPTRAYEEESKIHEVIDDYNEENFWSELVSRLAERDVHQAAKVANRQIESAEEYWELSSPHESRYAEEFEKNGLSRLKVSET